MLPILTILLSDMPRKMHASRRHSTINSLLSSPTQSCQDVEGRKGTSCCLPNIQTYQASDQPARFPRTKQQSQTSPNGNRPAYMSRGWASRNGISRHQDKRATLESFGNAHGTRAVDGSLLIRDKPLLLCFGHSVIPAYCVAVKMPPACYTWLWLETQ